MIEQISWKLCYKEDLAVEAVIIAYFKSAVFERPHKCFCLCPEVPYRQSVLHLQGTVDHRADLYQRPAGHHRGKEKFSINLWKHRPKVSECLQKSVPSAQLSLSSWQRRNKPKFNCAQSLYDKIRFDSTLLSLHRSQNKCRANQKWISSMI